MRISDWSSDVCSSDLTRKGGRVICAGIHMSDIPSFPYADLWGERTIASVANLTRDDVTSFFKVAQKARVKTVTTAFPLVDANIALECLRAGALVGAAVLLPGEPGDYQRQERF